VKASAITARAKNPRFMGTSAHLSVLWTEIDGLQNVTTLRVFEFTSG
jgi:hypothetical protein